MLGFKADVFTSPQVRFEIAMLRILTPVQTYAFRCANTLEIKNVSVATLLDQSDYSNEQP